MSKLPVLACLLATAALTAPADAEDRGPLKVVMLSGSEEYGSDASLEKLKGYLEAHYPASCTILKARSDQDKELAGLEALEGCDVALFFTRRLRIEGESLDRIKRYVEAGRPIVGVRTASHGFQNWLEFDKVVLGGNYRGHFSNDVTQRAGVEKSAADHPVLSGIGTIASRGSLYKAGPLADDCTTLMTSSTYEGREPATWTREHKGGRVFYTSLGAQGDFDNNTFQRLLTNALFWTARRDIPPRPVIAVQPELRPALAGTIRLPVRTRTESSPGAGDWKEGSRVVELPASETAIVICDMWDKHWCKGASVRCEAIARSMDPVLAAARAKGVQVVHAPSECMEFYADTPQRARARLAPEAAPPTTPETRPEPPLPIDDSDGGCDTDDRMYLAWTSQSPHIQVSEFDAVSDNGDEIYNLLRQLGVKNVVMMGVHTNMCVLNRSFAIKAMTRRGLNCFLVRDLTDTMYDPRDRPYVPHDQGTELVVQHIEKYWCPSLRSADFLAGLPK